MESRVRVILAILGIVTLVAVVRRADATVPPDLRDSWAAINDPITPPNVRDDAELRIQNANDADMIPALFDSLAHPAAGKPMHRMTHAFQLAPLRCVTIHENATDPEESAALQIACVRKRLFRELCLHAQPSKKKDEHLAACVRSAQSALQMVILLEACVVDDLHLLQEALVAYYATPGGDTALRRRAAEQLLSSLEARPRAFDQVVRLAWEHRLDETWPRPRPDALIGVGRTVLPQPPDPRAIALAADSLRQDAQRGKPLESRSVEGGWAAEVILALDGITFGAGTPSDRWEAMKRSTPRNQWPPVKELHDSWRARGEQVRDAFIRWHDQNATRIFRAAEERARQATGAPESTNDAAQPTSSDPE